MAKRQPRTILEACVATHGIHRGAIVAANVAKAAIAAVELGHVASGNEYAEFWAIDQRTSFRHFEGIADVFGPDWRDVVEQLAKRAEARGDRKARSVTKYPLPRGTVLA
jgi:hypothetical protein